MVQVEVNAILSMFGSVTPMTILNKEQSIDDIHTTLLQGLRLVLAVLNGKEGVPSVRLPDIAEETETESPLQQQQTTQPEQQQEEQQQQQPVAPSPHEQDGGTCCVQ